MSRSWLQAGMLFISWLLCGALGLWGSGRSAWFLFAVLSGFIGYVLLIQWLTLRIVEVKRQVSHQRYMAGDSIRVTVTVQSMSWFPLAKLTIAEPWSCNDQHLATHHSTYITGFYREIRFEYSLVEAARGVYTSPHIIVAATDVFGLFSKQVHISSQLDCLVLPVPTPIVSYEQPTRANGRGRTGQTLLSLPDQVKGIRPYTVGDPISRIHWKASAKGQGLQTMELDASLENEVKIMLDCAMPAELFESAISVCAGLVHQLEREDIPFTVRSSQAVQAASSELPTLEHSLYMLARATYMEKAEDIEDAYASLLRGYSYRVQSQSLFICLIAHLSDKLVQALLRLHKKGTKIKLIWLYEDTISFHDRQQLKELESFLCNVELLSIKQVSLYAQRKGEQDERSRYSNYS